MGLTTTRRAMGLLVVALPSSCGGGLPGARGPHGPAPPYTEHSAELFDDTIEASAIGYGGSSNSPPSADNLLRERAQVGEVLHAKVVTVTLSREGAGRSWQLGFHTLERLAGSNPPDVDFSLQVAPRDPAAGVLRAFEARLIGMSFVVFAREFARGSEGGVEDGASVTTDSRWHFHLARDDKDELNAVRAAAAAGAAR